MRPTNAPPKGAAATFNDHVTLNTIRHGRSVTIDAGVGAMGLQGKCYVYFFYRDKDNSYRLNYGEKTCTFEKRIAGTIFQLGAPVGTQNFGNGSPMQHWRIEAAPGTIKFIRDLPFATPADKARQQTGVLLNVSEPFGLEGGKIGLGGWARSPVWENFHFEVGAAAAPAKASASDR